MHPPGDVRSLLSCATTLSLAALLAACGDDAQGGGGVGGAGGAGGAPPVVVTLEVPAGAAQGDELVVTVRASSVAGSWADAEEPGAVLTVHAGANLARDVILVGGFASETRASLGAWDGGPVTYTLAGSASLDEVRLDVDPSAAGLPVIALMSNEFANDTPLLVYQSGDELVYVMTNEDGGTGLLPTLLLAQWGRPHDIEGLYDRVTHEYQAPEHASAVFDGVFEGSHPRLRMATSNGLVAPEPADGAALYHVSPVPVGFTTSDGVPREAVLDLYPWLVAAGWLEVAREGKVAEEGGVDDPMLGALGAYVFVDYRLSDGVKASFEVDVGGVTYSSLGIYAGDTGLTDSRSAGTGRTAIELAPHTTLADVTAVRVVPEEGAGSLESARVLAYDPVAYTPVVRGAISTPVPIDAAASAVELELIQAP
ncbi:MAG: hypothetical protein U0271_06165 [Polyangiaceae bacterium]